MNNFNNFLNHLNSFGNKQPIREQSSNYSYSDSSMKRLGKDLSNPTAIGAGALAGGAVGFALGGPPGALVGSAVGAVNGVGYNALPTMMNNTEDPELDTDFDRVQKRTEQEEQKRREAVSKANPDLAARMQEDPRNRPGYKSNDIPFARPIGPGNPVSPSAVPSSQSRDIPFAKPRGPVQENTYRSIFLNHLNSFSKKPIINESKRDPNLEGLNTTWAWGKRDWSDGTPELQRIKPGAGDDRASSLQTGEVSKHNAGQYFTSENPAIDVNDELIPHNEREMHAAAMHDANSDNMHIAVVQHIKSGRFSITDTTHARRLVRDGSNRHVATYTPVPRRNTIQEQKEKSSLKKKYKLNEISGRFWSPGPEGRGPDRVSLGSPTGSEVAAELDPTTLDTDMGGQPAFEPEDIQQSLRTRILAHDHQPFAEYHPTMWNPNFLVDHQKTLGVAQRAARSEHADEQTLLLAASHNDPRVREEAFHHYNATDNVKGMALLHNRMYDSMKSAFKKARISPTGLFDPKNKTILSAVGARLKDFRNSLSNHMSSGGNLLKFYRQGGEPSEDVPNN